MAGFSGSPSPHARQQARVALVQERLESLVRRAEAACADEQPSTYAVRETQRVYVQVCLQMALEAVGEVLPVALRPAVRRLLALHESVSQRAVSAGEGQG